MLGHPATQGLPGSAGYLSMAKRERLALVVALGVLGGVPGGVPGGVLGSSLGLVQWLILEAMPRLLRCHRVGVGGGLAGLAERPRADALDRAVQHVAS